MKEMKVGNVETPGNEFLPKKQELFCLRLNLPAQFKDDWILFRKLCKKKGSEFEDVLCDMIVQFNKGKISIKKIQDKG
jgi:hypothetical protein